MPSIKIEVKCKRPMIFHGFIHADSDDINDSIFRSNVIQFVADTHTHPIIKYQGFIVAGLLIVSGLLLLLLFNGERIYGHSYWKHLFDPLQVQKYLGGSDYTKTDAAIFREAIEGMTSSTTKTGGGGGSTSSNTKTVDGKTTNKSGQFVSADTDAPKKLKKTPCGTDCGQYLDLKRKISDLSKYVNAVKEQKTRINDTDKKLQALGVKIEDLNKSLSPGGQLNITI